jgi:CRP-like cAMP-binding protein
VQGNAKPGVTITVAAHPLAELLDCPPETGALLTQSAESLSLQAGDTVFRQDGDCRGLYVVVSGEFLRKSERLNTRITLGTGHAGDLVELAAALGNGHHTYTMTALTPGTVLMLPMAALRQAFDRHPPLRMHLLEELAREVSRAYRSCSLSRFPVRRNLANAQ